jgi:hypothetical protein
MRDEYKLRVIENKILRRTFTHKKEKVLKSWKE